jgi:hypothetical protein
MGSLLLLPKATSQLLMPFSLACTFPKCLNALISTVSQDGIASQSQILQFFSIFKFQKFEFLKELWK